MGTLARYPGARRSTYKRRYGPMRARRQRFGASGVGGPRFGQVPRGETSTFKVVENVNGLTMTLGARTILQLPAVVTPFAMQFRLADCGNVASYAAIFDQYRIVKVQVDLCPMMALQNIAIAGGGAYDFGLLATAIDYDNAGVGANTLNLMQQYDTYRYQPIINAGIHRRVIYPRPVQTGVVNTAGTTGREILPANTWIDVGQTDVLYNGLAIFLDAGPIAAQSNQIFHVQCKYWLEFKHTR